nr:hypothetical protein [Tanacetum cinerariifolium]
MADSRNFPSQQGIGCLIMRISDRNSIQDITSSSYYFSPEHSRSDDKFSQMLTQLESQPEYGGGSGSGGCRDDEPGDDEDGGEDEEEEDDS